METNSKEELSKNLKGLMESMRGLNNYLQGLKNNPDLTPDQRADMDSKISEANKTVLQTEERINKMKNNF